MDTPWLGQHRKEDLTSYGEKGQITFTYDVQMTRQGDTVGLVRLDGSVVFAHYFGFLGHAPNEEDARELKAYFANRLSEALRA